MNKSIQALMSRASAAESQHDFQSANQLYGEVLSLDSGNREALLYHGLTLTMVGKPRDAVAQLEKLVVIDPNCLIALNWLSKLERESGRLQSALTYSERAVQVKPNDLEALYNMGLCFLGLTNFEAAIQCFERAIAISDRFGPGHYALACAYEAIGQPWQALIAIKRSVEIDAQPQSFLLLAQCYLAVGDNSKAIVFGLKAFEAAPTAAARFVLAEAYADSDAELARVHFESAVKMNPNLEAAYQNKRAKTLSRLGRLEEARNINADLRDKEGASGPEYLNWVTIKKIDEGDAEIIDRMTRLLESQSLSGDDKCALNYALGKSYDDIGDFEKAIAHYDEANVLKFANTPSLSSFDPDALSHRIDSLIRLYTREFLAANENSLNKSARPIFIVGMMRTGTTLIEQLLCRHANIVGGGELAHWPYSAKKIIDIHRGAINRENLLVCIATYLKILQTISSSAERVTDKNPANILEVGLIRLAFPQAHIIQMERDPIDTALSIYITPTRHPPEFGCDRENIVSAIEQTQRLERHWREVVPSDRYHRVRYEELVMEPETVIPELMTQCGLDANEWRLTSTQAQPLVGTPSLWQARQAITSASVGRSKRYTPWLREFENLG